MHKMLGIALVEIRAAEHLDSAQALADIFHNVPAMISTGHAEEEILDTVMRVAERRGMSDYIGRLHQNCLNILGSAN